LRISTHSALVRPASVWLNSAFNSSRPADALVRVHARRRFDLDHVGAEIGELPHARRTRAHAREVEDAKARERPRSGGV